jgi:hypothetical protein
MIGPTISHYCIVEKVGRILSIEEAAEVLGISRTTAKSNWNLFQGVVAAARAE